MYMAQPSGKRLFRLEFTPLEFETLIYQRNINS